MKYKYKLTLFTPCYNGGKTISRLFDCVEAQTCKEFEWIIINDGSIDDTDEVIRSRITSSSFSNIRYKSNPQNKGKHRIWNEAVDMANGELFLPIDCDDTILEESVSFFIEKWDNISNPEWFSGINVCCFAPNTGNVVGDLYAEDALITDNLELIYKYRLKGEHWGCIKTDVAKKIKFPEIKSNYYSGTYLISSIALTGLKLICFNKALRGYYIIDQSLSHTKFRDFKFSRVYMEFHCSMWKVSHLSCYLMKHSKIDLIRLYANTMKSILRVLFFPFRKLL